MSTYKSTYMQPRGAEHVAELELLVHLRTAFCAFRTGHRRLPRMLPFRGNGAKHVFCDWWQTHVYTSISTRLGPRSPPRCRSFLLLWLGLLRRKGRTGGHLLLRNFFLLWDSTAARIQVTIGQLWPSHAGLAAHAAAQQIKMKLYSSTALSDRAKRTSSSLLRRTARSHRAQGPIHHWRPRRRSRQQQCSGSISCHRPRCKRHGWLLPTTLICTTNIHMILLQYRSFTLIVGGH